MLLCQTTCLPCVPTALLICLCVQIALTPLAALTSEGLYLVQTPAWAGLPPIEQQLLQHMAVHLQPEVLDGGAGGVEGGVLGVRGAGKRGEAEDGAGSSGRPEMGR